MQNIEESVHITADNNKVHSNLTSTIDTAIDKSETVTPTLKKYGCYRLTVVDKSSLCTDHFLNNIHMGAAQELIKKQFPP